MLVGLIRETEEINGGLPFDPDPTRPPPRKSTAQRLDSALAWSATAALLIVGLVVLLVIGAAVWLCRG